MKTVLKLLIFVLFVVSVVVLSVPFFIDWNSYKSKIEDSFFELTGLHLSIDGDVNLQILPYPSVSAGALSISNPEYSSKHDGAFLTIGRIDLSMAYEPLLMGQVEFNKLNLFAPKLILQKNADGLMNWQTDKILQLLDDRKGQENKEGHGVEDIWISSSSNALIENNKKNKFDPSLSVFFRDIDIRRGDFVLDLYGEEKRVFRDVGIHVGIHVGAKTHQGPFSVDGDVKYLNQEFAIHIESQKIIPESETISLQADVSVLEEGVSASFSGVVGLENIPDIQGELSLRLDNNFSGALARAYLRERAPPQIFNGQTELKAIVTASSKEVILDDVVILEQDDEIRSSSHLRQLAQGQFSYKILDGPRYEADLSMAFDQVDLSSMMDGNETFAQRDLRERRELEKQSASVSDRGKAADADGKGIPSILKETFKVPSYIHLKSNVSVKRLKLKNKHFENVIFDTSFDGQEIDFKNISFDFFFNNFDSPVKVNLYGGVEFQQEKSSLETQSMMLYDPKMKLHWQIYSEDIDDTVYRDLVNQIFSTWSEKRKENLITLYQGDFLFSGHLSAGFSNEQEARERKFVADLNNMSFEIENNKSTALTGQMAVEITQTGRREVRAKFHGANIQIPFPATGELDDETRNAYEANRSAGNVSAVSASNEARKLNITPGETLPEETLEEKIEQMVENVRGQDIFDFAQVDLTFQKTNIGGHKAALIPYATMKVNASPERIDLAVFEVQDWQGVSLSAKGLFEFTDNEENINLISNIKINDFNKSMISEWVNYKNLDFKLDDIDLVSEYSGDLNEANLTLNASIGDATLLATTKSYDLFSDPRFDVIELQLSSPKSTEITSFLMNLEDENWKFVGKTDLYAKISPEYSRDLKNPDKLSVQAIHIDNIQGDILGSSVKGQVDVTLHQEVPMVSLNMDFGRLDFDAYQNNNAAQLAKTKSYKNKKAVKGKHLKDDVRWSRNAIDVGWMHDFEMELDLSANEIHRKDLVLRNFQIKAGLKQGVFHVNQARGDIFDGRLSFNGKVKGARDLRRPLEISGAFKLRELNVADFALFAKDLPVFPVEGRFSYDADFSTFGLSPAALIYGLNGSGRVLADDVILKGIDLDEISRGLSSLNHLRDVPNLLGKALSGGQTSFASFAGEYEMTEGVAQISRLDLDGEFAKISAKGEVDLPMWELEIPAILHIKKPNNVPEFNAKIYGSLSHPDIDFISHSLESFLKTQLRQKLDRILDDKLDDKLGGALKGILGKMENSPGAIEGNGQPVNDAEDTSPSNKSPSTEEKIIRGILGEILK